MNSLLATWIIIPWYVRVFQGCVLLTTVLTVWGIAKVLLARIRTPLGTAGKGASERLARIILLTQAALVAVTIVFTIPALRWFWEISRFEAGFDPSGPGDMKFPVGFTLLWALWAAMATVSLLAWKSKRRQDPHQAR